MGRLLLAVFFVISFATPASAAASASPMPAPPVPLPGLVITGAAVAEDVRLEVRCVGTDALSASSFCRVVLRARLRAVDEVQLQLPSSPAITTIDGEPTSDATLAPGRIADLEVTFERALSVTTEDRDSPWIIAAPRVRHMFLGESSSTHRSGEAAYGELFGGAEIEVSGAIHCDVEPGAVDVRLGGTPVARGSSDVSDARGMLSLAVSVDEEPASAVQHGGPYVGAGIWGPIDQEDAPFELRVGYELGLADWVIASIGFETDFDSIAESVLVEVATPELAILIPSLSLGVGAVFRQLGDRDADAALRLAMGYQIFALGTYADFDYWPDTGGWTIAAGGRLSF